MLIKSADPTNTQRITLLQTLQKRRRLDAFQSRWVSSELARQRAGQNGERDAAHYINTHYRDSPNIAVLHDLRLVVDGEVAQIDHLLISRAAIFYLLETKNLNGNLDINAQGEFTAEYGRERYGIPSPLEQSRRHEVVLARMLERLGITGRLGSPLRFEHVVMLHPQATITRPSAKSLDTSYVIKADQIASWHERHVNNLSALAVLGRMPNMRSQETLREWGEKLVRQHRPADAMGMPDFMQPALAVLETPRPGMVVTPPMPPSSPMGDIAQRADPSLDKQPASTDQAVTANVRGDETKRRLICATCGERISFAEGKFCWNNPARFGGLQYCRAHQTGSKSRSS